LAVILIVMVKTVVEHCRFVCMWVKDVLSVDQMFLLNHVFDDVKGRYWNDDEIRVF
jgi:hypothetical protein